MPRAEEEAWEVANAAAALEDGTVDRDRRSVIYREEYERRLAERQERLMNATRAVFRSMDGWPRIKDEDDWRRMVREAAEDLESGNFLLDRLGGERYLDPELMAALLVLRRRLIDEYGAESAADIMLIDVAMLSYYHTIRINGWIGNFSTMFEGEFFGKEGLSVVVDGRKRSTWDTKIKGLRVIDVLERIGEQLLPLLDRSNRMMLRNLKALEARRQPLTPTVSIGQAGQVNVAAVQTNGGGQRADAVAAEGQATDA